MIYGTIHAGISEGAYSGQILKAIRYCREMDVDNMPVGRYSIDGDNMFVNISEVTTAPKEEQRAEKHSKYIDVQFMAKGHEYIGFWPDCGDGEILRDLTEERDICFYKAEPDVNEIMLPMTDGCYAVFFPEDIHRPCCQMEQPETVKKAVIKIKVESL